MVPSVGAAAENSWSYFRNLVVLLVAVHRGCRLQRLVQTFPRSCRCASHKCRSLMLLLKVPSRKKALKTNWHIAFCNTELHDKWKVAKQSACHLSMVPYRDTHTHTRSPSLMDFDDVSVPPICGPGVSKRTYSDLLFAYSWLGLRQHIVELNIQSINLLERI